MSTMTAVPKRWISFLLPVVVLYWGMMFVGTHLPHIELPGSSTIVSIDKILHFCGYLGLGFLLSLLIVTSAARRGESELFALRKRGYLVLLVIAAYAIFDELTQLLVGRSCELLDGTADLLGALCGVLIVAIWVAIRNDPATVAEVLED